MMQTHDDRRETLALHALGGTEPADRAAIDAHLAGCPACAAELAALEEAAADLALLAPAVAPPADSLPRLLVALDTGAPRVHARARRRRRPLAVAGRVTVVAAVALLCLAVWHLHGRLTDARRELAAMRDLGRFVTSADVSVVSLWGPEGARGPHAKLAYDHETGRFVFLSSRMPPLPEGQGFRLWVVSEQVRPAGAVSPVAPDGVLPSPPRGDGPFFFAVSIEPADASDEPTSPFLLVSPPLRNPH
jgi:hypothetical protein